MLANVTYTKGIHNVKAGVTYEQTFLNENDQFGIVDPVLNAPCLNGNAVPVNGFTDPSQCAAAGLQPNIASNPNAPNSALYPLFNNVLLPYDLTRGGVLFPFVGHTDVKELAMYVQDNITLRNWSFNLGIRGDFYNGLTTASQAEPRVGIAYNVQKTNTILRVSYARTLETPFNENLVLSSVGCSSPVLNPLLGCTSSTLTPLTPGFRNEFHAGFQQAIWAIPGGRWRIHLEVHAHWIRFQCVRQHTDFLSDRLAQLEDSGLGAARQHAGLPWLQRAGGDVKRRCAVLHATDLGSWSHSLGAVGRLSALTTTKPTT